MRLLIERLAFAGVGMVLACLFTGCVTPEKVEEDKPMQPFGGDDSVAYAQELWRNLAGLRLVGPGAITAKPYEGTHPHGIVLVTYESEVQVGEHTGIAIVKNNYAGAGVSESSVADQPDQNLDSVTVMFKREKGYDPDNADWFWVKYQPDGSLHVNTEGVSLAGRIAKGKRQGCIACHKLAPGNDLVYNHNRYSK